MPWVHCTSAATLKKNLDKMLWKWCTISREPSMTFSLKSIGWTTQQSKTTRKKLSKKLVSRISNQMVIDLVI